MLRVDIAALRRISSFYKSCETSDSHKQLSPKGSACHVVSHGVDITESLARALADEYLHKDNATKANQRENTNSISDTQPSRAPMLVLQHLEKASLPVMLDGKTCGSWLSTGIGDGAELRSQQKADSQHWNLVTVFCQMHHLPLSTTYLGVLARDNDWVCSNVFAIVWLRNVIPVLYLMLPLSSVRLDFYMKLKLGGILLNQWSKW